jgi:hypothetical protein
MMSADDDVFIAGDRPAGEVRKAIETALGERFEPSIDLEPMPALFVGHTLVYFHDDHEFCDDRDLRFTQYRYWVNVHDTDRDADRQLAVARRVFEVARAAGWPALLARDLQQLVDRYEPGRAD